MAQLQVPINDDLLKRLKLAAIKSGKTLRDFVSDALKQAVTK